MKNVSKFIIAVLALQSAQTAYAAVPEIYGDRLVDGVLSTVIYGLIGIIMAIFAFKIIDFGTPGDLKQQLVEEKNVALGVVVGLLMLGICIIIAAAVAG